MRIAIERGAIVAERTVANVKADPVLLAAARRLGFDGLDSDAQAILDFCLIKVLDYLVGAAKSRELQVASDASTTNLEP